MDSNQKKNREGSSESSGEAHDKVPQDVEIKNWLKKQGYPLEMFVARTVEAAEFHVIRSGSYVDPDTEKLREIDLTAQRHSEGQPVLVQAGFAIECKLSKNPWILFPANSRPLHFAPLNLICSDLSKRLLGHRFTPDKLDDKVLRIQHLDWFQSDHIGSSITQAFTTGPDVTYQALMGSVKACLHRIQQINEDVKIPGSKPMSSIMFPAIVIDGQLFESHLDAAENIVINEIESGIVAWDGASHEDRVEAYVRIATRKSLNGLVNNMRKTADTVIDFHVEHMDWLIEAAKSLKTGYF